MSKQEPRDCKIEQVGKQRNGRPRYWCWVHQASATGRYGARLSACEGAYRTIVRRNVLELDPSDYPGGVALWGAVAPVYDTTGLPPEEGIHVHARKGDGSDKEIDATYDAVAVRYKRDLVEDGLALINSEAAVSYYISQFLGRDVRHLFCTHCGELHLDKGFFAVKPHRRHLCHGCGRYFRDDRRGVSNPIALIRENLNLVTCRREPERPNRLRTIHQREFAGGIQIWASNPAILWTAERPEEEGLHVHAFSAPGQLAFDETFSEVTVDGIVLDESQVQHLMAQLALPYLANKVVSLVCPECGAPHFDRGELAFFPHVKHSCDECGATFVAPGRRRLVVSNPFIDTRNRLAEMSAVGQVGG